MYIYSLSRILILEYLKSFYHVMLAFALHVFTLIKNILKAAADLFFLN